MKAENSNTHSEYFNNSRAHGLGALIPSKLWSFSVDVDVDIDSLCRIGQMAERITNKLGTVTLQVVISSSSES